METINNYERKIRSQNGEDGIIEEIFSRLKVPNGFFVEFGVQDGLECNTAHLCIDRQWSGMMIEGSGAWFSNLVTHYQSIHHHIWNQTNYFGASLSSLAELGKQLGYALIGTDSRGVNAFFTRNDLVDIAGFPELAPETAYNKPSYGHFNGGHPPGSGPFIEI